MGFVRRSKGKDYLLNKAFGDAFRELLRESGAEVARVGSKEPIYNDLRPDVHIRRQDAEPICLEFTWRTTGRDRRDGAQAAQNTLARGHIVQYVLKKVFDYVKALGLDAPDFTRAFSLTSEDRPAHTPGSTS
jgi:hypothetical protein